MKHIQKLVLVPIEKWEKLGENIPVKEVTVQSVPQKNLSVPSVAMTQPKKVTVKNQKGLGKMKKSRMFHFLPLKKRSKANALFDYLGKNEIISWNDNGELVQNDIALPETNIIQLIKHAVQNDTSKPSGMKFFYQTLSKKNIPIDLISNKFGRKIMKKSLYHKTSSWRPPGRLSHHE